MLRVLLSGLILIAAPSAAQYMDYGVSLPKLGKETLDAGIGSYHLERLESGDFRMEVFDPKGEHLTVCSIDLRSPTKRTITCSFDGKFYKATYFAESASFEDLATGDYITVTFEVPAQEPRVSVPEPGDPLPQPPKPIVRGTKTLEEARKEWEPQMTLTRLAFAELEATLKGAPTLSGPQGATTCPNGNDPVCGPSTIGPLSAHLYTNVTSCCSDLSAAMDSRCRAINGNPCCANTPCEGTCLVLCSCSLSGILFSCPVCV